MEIDGKSRVDTVTPVLSLVAYSDGDQMGIAMELKQLLDNPGDTEALQTVSVLDKAKQKSAFDILFFDTAPIVSSVDNAPLDISDSEMAAKYIGKASIAATSYSDLASNSIGILNNLGLLIQGAGNSASANYSIWCILQCRGTPTYTSASDLVVKIGAFQD